jgi:hypothetical protein
LPSRSRASGVFEGSVQVDVTSAMFAQRMRR